MRGVADIARRFGSGSLRLTVWQNLLITDVPDNSVEAAREALKSIGLSCDASSFRAGLVACTGNQGCKYAAGNTKAHAMALAEYLESRFDLDQPVNIHVTAATIAAPNMRSGTLD